MVSNKIHKMHSVVNEENVRRYNFETHIGKANDTIN